MLYFKKASKLGVLSEFTEIYWTWICWTSHAEGFSLSFSTHKMLINPLNYKVIGIHGVNLKKQRSASYIPTWSIPEASNRTSPKQCFMSAPCTQDEQLKFQQAAAECVLAVCLFLCDPEQTAVLVSSSLSTRPQSPPVFWSLLLFSSNNFASATLRTYYLIYVHFFLSRGKIVSLICLCCGVHDVYLC